MNRKYVLRVAVISCLLAASCSVNKMATKAVADALTGEGSSEVFTRDSDPRLVGDALPFAIKMYEALLEANPQHQGLLQTAGSLFVMYANAFVQGPAEMLPQGMFAERQAEMERAKALYLRGLGLLYRSLDLKYPGFDEASRGGPASRERLPEILAKMKKPDAPSLYWAAVAGVSAFSVNPFDFGLGMRIGEFLALANRAYELDPDFNKGALDEFFLLFHASVPEGMGGNPALVETHFQRALEKSGGLLAGPYVSYARVVIIPAQDYDSFIQYMDAALAIDPDADPPNRLVNILSQQKARYLLDSASRFFVTMGEDNGFWDEDTY